MLNYQSAKGSFPPLFGRVGKGRPSHSWRVAILPFLDRDDLFDEYNFDQPWDSAENRKLLPKIPVVMQCPDHIVPGMTTYKLVTGRGSVFTADKPPTAADIRDGPSNTIMMIEDFSNPIPWTKPEDVPVDKAVEILTAANTRNHLEKCAHSAKYTWATYPVGTIVAFFDGRQCLVGIDSEPDEIRALLLVDDGAKIDSWNLSPRNTTTFGTVNWPGTLLLGLFAGLIFAPYLYSLKLQRQKRYWQKPNGNQC